jgi:NTE family protein
MSSVGFPGTTQEPPVGLVLAGGCARGAYELGALSVLLPKLEELGQRPRVLTGTSVGALNVSFLAARADEAAADAVAAGERLWRTLAWKDVIGHVVSLRTILSGVEYAGQVLGWPGAHLWSLLDSTPLKATTERDVDFARLHRNVASGVLHAAAVVTTSALTHRTVVFHDGGGVVPFDEPRLISYVNTPLAVEHVGASTSMPAIFPAVHVSTVGAEGWYYDGGTRLNAPLKPALQLGAGRLVVIGLTSLSPGPTALAGEERPDAFTGIGLLLRGLMGDQMQQGVQTLARINEAVLEDKGGSWNLVPYIAVAPEQSDTIEKLAYEVFSKRYRNVVSGLRRSADVEIVGRVVGAAAAPMNATLLSLLLFDPEFIEALIELGATDAQRWISQPQDDGIWRLRSMSSGDGPRTSEDAAGAVPAGQGPGLDARPD